MAWAIITIYTSKCAQMDPQQLLKTSRCKSVISKNLSGTVGTTPLGSPKVNQLELQQLQGSRSLWVYDPYSLHDFQARHSRRSIITPLFQYCLKKSVTCPLIFDSFPVDEIILLILVRFFSNIEVNVRSLLYWLHQVVLALPQTIPKCISKDVHV